MKSNLIISHYLLNADNNLLGVENKSGSLIEIIIWSRPIAVFGFPAIPTSPIEQIETSLDLDAWFRFWGLQKKIIYIHASWLRQHPFI